MPTNLGESKDWGKNDNYYYPESDGETWSHSHGGDWDGQDMNVGVVAGGPKMYANGWDHQSHQSHAGWYHQSHASSSSSNPLYWFHPGAPHASNAFPAQRMSWVDPSGYSDSSPASAVHEPVKKLLEIREQRAKLKEAEGRLAAKVFDNAAGGLMSHYAAGSSEEHSFVSGFLQGAVQASKKSVEQQGEFAKQLESQSDIVTRLEGIVAELEDEMRKQNWKKTAEKVGEGEDKEQEAEPESDEEGGYQEKEAKPKFDIEFYMEAECPACKAFATRVIPAVLNAFDDMINLTAIPFGNAAVVNGTIHCQHGPDECLGNKIELCVMDLTPKWQDWFPVFKCIEKSHDSPLNASKKCLPTYGYDTENILGCARGDKGELLHLAAAKKTLSLQPPHKWTPWLVMDGKPLGDKAGSILGMICKKLPEHIHETVQACNPKYEEQNKETLAAFDSKRGYCYPDKALTQLMTGK
uniref:Thioredoxin-like fold domain-containing protein n=3 Tax=Hemiselmis andersenii TaxID=464988 RepID=A0A7S1EJB3_HEMAN|mmetsp:Transcript_50871/g.123362  ORF Transcript_50871/g.123362 Transcript_50871/m.123362 type:complete len:466 (+) Transcript_50871:2-1399(+)